MTLSDNLSLESEALEEQYAATEFRGRATSKHQPRARSKRRPSTSEFPVGTVAFAARGRYHVWLPSSNNSAETINLTCARARELRDTDIVVGDHVRVKLPPNFDASTAANQLGRICSLEPRHSSLARTTDDTKTAEKVIAANIDTCVIVQSTTSPEPQVDFLRRCFVAAKAGGAEAIFYLTKTDLEPDFAVAKLTDLLGETPKIVRTPEELLVSISGTTAAFVGLSGVGKSTLLNLLVPEANRATSGVMESTGDGRHTSTSSEMFMLDTAKNQPTILPAPSVAKNQPTILIDTPGVRSFGLGHLIEV